jgi:CubicO group peptidase (beta-lactamase class C family)
MPVPVHQLATTEDFLRVLDGYTTKFEPGERFEYNNGIARHLAEVLTT